MSEKICPVMSNRFDKQKCREEDCQWWWKCREPITRAKAINIVHDIIENGGHSDTFKSELIADALGLKEGA